jgi:hypothetical protein
MPPDDTMGSESPRACRPAQRPKAAARSPSESRYSAFTELDQVRRRSCGEVNARPRTRPPPVERSELGDDVTEIRKLEPHMWGPVTSESMWNTKGCQLVSLS